MIQYIESDGKKQFAVLPIDELERLITVAENAADLRAVHATADDETLSQEFVEKLIHADSPLTVWREYRNMTQKALETASGVPQGYIAQLESGKKRGSVDTLKALSKALKITIEDLL